MFSWLLRKPPPPPSEADLYFKRMESLGFFRRMVLAMTLSDNNPRNPQYFNPPEEADLNAAFLEHLEGLWARWLPKVTEQNIFDTDVVAAGLLSYGRLEMADYILDHLPEQFILGAYRDQVGPRMMFEVLPTPVQLGGWAQWIAGSPEAEAVRSWLAANRASLQWEPSSGKFVLRQSEGARAEPSATADGGGM